jgi:hypothetical protein
VKAGVVAEHEWRQVLLSFHGGMVYVGGKVLCDGIVGNLGLTVGLRMTSCGVDVLDPKVFEQLFGGSRAKCFALVGGEIYGGAKILDPMFKDGTGDGGSLLGGEGNELNILGEGISDA